MIMTGLKPLYMRMVSQMIPSSELGKEEIVTILCQHIVRHNADSDGNGGAQFCSVALHKGLVLDILARLKLPCTSK
jgi:hypothetical protein